MVPDRIRPWLLTKLAYLQSLPAAGRIAHAFPAICFKRFGTEPIPGLFRTFRSLYTRRPQFAFAAFMGLKWTSNRNRYCLYHRQVVPDWHL